MFTQPLYVYNNDKSSRDTIITTMIGAEIRAAIQNWRKQNKLPIDFRIPTLCVYFTKDIIKTALIEGLTDTFTKTHLFEICLVDKVVFMDPRKDVSVLDTRDKRWNGILNGIQLVDHDIIFWSPLGGTIGFANPTKGNSDNIQKEVDTAEKMGYYNHYV